MTTIVLRWLLTLPILITVVFCTGTTLRAYENNWLVLVWLLPGCFTLWLGVVLCLIGLVKQLEFSIVVREPE